MALVFPGLLVDTEDDGQLAVQLSPGNFRQLNGNTHPVRIKSTCHTITDRNSYGTRRHPRNQHHFKL
jgi:hypothetical protein